MSEAQRYEYAPDPEAERVVVTLRRNGRWVAKGQPMRSGRSFAVGHRNSYYDFSS
jgi:hypothetical protein